MPLGLKARPGLSPTLRLRSPTPLEGLDDPKGVARILAGMGRWDNGEVEIAVAPWKSFPMPAA